MRYNSFKVIKRTFLWCLKFTKCFLLISQDNLFKSPKANFVCSPVMSNDSRGAFEIFHACHVIKI